MPLTKLRSRMVPGMIMDFDRASGSWKITTRRGPVFAKAEAIRTPKGTRIRKSLDVRLSINPAVNGRLTSDHVIVDCRSDAAGRASPLRITGMVIRRYDNFGYINAGKIRYFFHLDDCQGCNPYAHAKVEFAPSPSKAHRYQAKEVKIIS